MPQYWCGICQACVILFGMVWVGITLYALICLFSGAWIAFAWVGGASLVFGGWIFLTAYFEARSHWKRRDN